MSPTGSACAPPIACEGAPRDLGLDQGRGCGHALRARFGRRTSLRRLALRAGWVGPRTRRIARDLARHFPHHAEALQGLGVGAGVPTAWLVDELAGEVESEGVRRPLAVATGPGLLARGLEGPWLLRRSTPEGLFASLELTRPWLAHALAGVNERGLALAVLAASTEPFGRCAAPAVLLAQDCLERFEGLEAALEWCSSRPAGGRALLLLADARGELAGLAVDGGSRRVLRPCEGRLVSGGAPGAAGELDKRLAEAPPGDVESLAAALPGDVESLAAALPGAAVAVDAPGRRLFVAGRSVGL